MEKGLYSQVVKLHWKGLISTEADKNENEYKFKLQGLSAISHRWFNLDFDWIEVNFDTNKSDFIKETFKNSWKYTRYKYI